MSLSGFFGVNSSNHLSSVFNGLLGVEGSLTSGNTLANNFGVFIDPNVGFSGREKEFGGYFADHI